MSEVEKAEATCRDLILKRDQLIARGTELDEERRRVAFAAHTGDQDARKQLDAINQETARHTSELASFDAAIAEAAQRLEVARHAAEVAADRAKALVLRAVLQDFGATGKRLSEALAAVVTESKQLAELVTSINALGAPNPSSRQLLVIGRLAILTALRQTMWARDFDAVPPNDRRDFVDLVGGWSAMIEKDISRQLGEAEPTEVAA